MLDGPEACATDAADSLMLLAETIQQAGWPDGALNVLPLSNEDASLLVTDDRIKLISFTGSVPVGWDIKKRAGKKKVVLELGGNAGVIVHSDADLSYAAQRCVAGGFAYAGQSCISVQRILVERSVYGKFTDLFLAGVKELKTGDPLEESTDLGPMIRESDAVRATAMGGGSGSGWGEIVLRRSSQRLDYGTHGALPGPSPEMKVNCQEIFAPVVTVEAYENFD